MGRGSDLLRLWHTLSGGLWVVALGQFSLRVHSAGPEGSYDQTPLWVTGQVCGRTGSHQPQVDDPSDHQDDREGFWELTLHLESYKYACRPPCPLWAQGKSWNRFKAQCPICEKGSLHMMLCSSAAETHGEDLMQRIVNIEKHQFPALHPLGNHWKSINTLSCSTQEKQSALQRALLGRSEWLTLKISVGIQW